MSARMSSDRNPADDVPVRRIDRILTFMSLGIVVLSIGCFFAIMIGTAVGLEQADFGSGVWPVVGAVPLFGLPLAFVMIALLLVMTMIRRARANRAR